MIVECIKDFDLIKTIRQSKSYKNIIYPIELPKKGNFYTVIETVNSNGKEFYQLNEIRYYWLSSHFKRRKDLDDNSKLENKQKEFLYV